MATKLKEKESYRQLDPYNRISIPKKMLDDLGIESEELLQVKIEHGNIVLQPLEIKQRR